MRWLPKTIVAIAVLASLSPLYAFAQETTSTPDATPIVVQPDEFIRGVVIERVPRRIEDTDIDVQEVKVLVTSGSVKGETVELTLGGAFGDPETGVQIEDEVVLVRSVSDGVPTYYLADRYRLPWIITIVALMLIAAFVIGKKRGVTATLGLAASVVILAFVMIPQMAGGANPILVVFLGGVAIATVTTFIAHGVRKDSMLVLSSILISLIVGSIGALLATWTLNLGGLGSEEAVALTYGPLAGMDFRGLLVAGVILGCLGVLDDVAATQVATVKEIAAADPRLTRRQLYRRGMRVGSEHVAALINTLFLAYAGASLPLLLVGRVNLQLPVWAFLNTESVAEEIVRTVVGSTALILAVPIATLLAAWQFGAKRGVVLRKEDIVV